MTGRELTYVGSYFVNLKKGGNLVFVILRAYVEK